MHQFTITTPEGERVFTLREKFPLVVSAWHKRVSDAYKETVDASTLTSKDYILGLIAYTLEDAERVNGCIKCAYLGDHSGIDFFEHEDADEAKVGEAVASFFVTWWNPRIESMSKLLKSSAPIPRNSEKAKEKTVHTQSKKLHGKSQRRRKTSTT